MDLSVEHGENVGLEYECNDMNVSGISVIEMNSKCGNDLLE